MSKLLSKFDILIDGGIKLNNLEELDVNIKCNLYETDISSSFIVFDYDYNFKYESGFFNLFEISNSDNFKFDDFKHILKNILDYELIKNKHLDDFDRFINKEINSFSLKKIYYSINDKILFLSINFAKLNVESNDYFIVTINNETDFLKENLFLSSQIEKQEVVLKECHHRIKNNLQILNGLIKLQKRFGLNHDEIINSTMVSISSIALIHKNMYSNDWDNDFVLVSDFFNDFMSSIDEFYGKLDINFSLDIKNDVSIHENKLSNLAIILNELIVNSIKYAFNESNNDEDKISIMTYCEEGYFIFVYEDNGVGISEDSNSGTHLGFILIESIVNQIDGEYKLISSDGFKFSVKFPILD